ncbi:DUF1190 domain-containing protein [Pseudomonas aeruginosa]|jgi:uncharacterized protein YgiB involved in biofilm formation|uniref:Uncharacterized conserved protein YgiB, involved in bioifilm formation, UPF0441/DUF1190 family n=1 Tax=Pseudomonas saponiphila TaxID=556534 RepID=A0A1H4ZNU7_9PSED|nr:DUF1190 domain-containing protein [Pseudomonas saponiphila]SED31647.1 Uncharacterized conserved protein YgiB, involved in bioifilm formation, UPF0441/DUF1190 family [Pseudomonas saponiphila]
MKRSSQLKLGMVTAIPLVLSACSQPNEPAEKMISGSVKNSYDSVQQCVDDKLPVDVCSDAYMAALAQHKKIAPAYKDEESCEADFVPDYCAVTSEGLFMPKLGGFEIAAQYSLPESQVAAMNGGSLAGVAAPVSAAAAGVASSNDGLLTGLLLGQMLGNGSARYYSEPIYVHRDSRGAFSRSTLSRQISAGKSFERSVQVTSGQRYTTASKPSITSALKRPTAISSKPVTVASTSSRGGFGSQSAARSGWGMSSGRSSFGG